MPAILHNDMTELELLRHTVAAYADESNWEECEKDYGTDERGRQMLVMRSPWSSRDKGWMARRALELIAAKKPVGNGRIRNALRIAGGAALMMLFFYVMAWVFAVGCVLAGNSQAVCGL